MATVAPMARSSASRGRPRTSAESPRAISLADLLQALGANLAKARSRAKLTQEEVAELLDIHPRYYQRVEAGKQPVTLRTLVHLASALGVEPVALLKLPRRTATSARLPEMPSSRARRKRGRPPLK